MRFFQAILSSAAFAALVAALEINQFPSSGVVAGNTYTITYSPADNVPTTFILRQGQSTNLDTIATLTTTATGGTFQWTPDKSLANQADYALEIKRGDTVNYSGQFPLTGGSDSKPVSSNSPSATPSATASASSASKSSASSSASMSSSMAMSSSASPSASPSPSSASNSTVSSATLSRSTASRTPTGTATVPEVTGNAGNSLLANPIAAIAGAAAAFAYLA